MQGHADVREGTQVRIRRGFQAAPSPKHPALRGGQTTRQPPSHVQCPEATAKQPALGPGCQGARCWALKISSLLGICRRRKEQPGPGCKESASQQAAAWPRQVARHMAGDICPGVEPAGWTGLSPGRRAPASMTGSARLASRSPRVLGCGGVRRRVDEVPVGDPSTRVS